MKYALPIAAAFAFTLATNVLVAADPGELAVGQVAPDFSVTNSEGKTIKLSERTQSGKHVAVMFSRAKW